jgi:hypothetical protein
LKDYQKIEDVHTIDDLKTFAWYAIDLLYPKLRTNSTDPSFFSKHDEENLRYEEEQEWLIGNNTERDPGVPITLFNYFNYFCGMELRVMEGKLEDNDNNLTRRVITHQKTYQKTTNSEDDFDEDYGSEILHEYFPGHLKRQDALDKLNGLIDNGWINDTVHQPMTNT